MKKLRVERNGTRWMAVLTDTGKQEVKTRFGDSAAEAMRKVVEDKQ